MDGPTLSHLPPTALYSRRPAEGLGVWRKCTLAALLVALLAFGVIIEIRSAFLTRRMTDLGVYARAAWAVRTGADLYAIEDENHWHYQYPPLLAILLTPFADPPRGTDHSGYVPFAVTAAFWYTLGVACYFGWLLSPLGVACYFGSLLSLAHAVEPTLYPAGQRPTARSYLWWDLRMLPFFLCLFALGSTLARGQVNAIVLLLLSAMIACQVRGRRVLAGLALAGAICLKVIPAYLIIYALWRRDWRHLAGCTLGLALGLGLIPALAMGPERAVAAYADWMHVLVRPALARGEDRSRAAELIEITATDSQSLLAVLHNSLHPNRWTRPANASPMVRATHWLGGGLLTLVTLAAAGRRRLSAPREMIFLGMLIINMLLLSPVCHLHYFALDVPLTMGLIAAVWQTNGPGRLGLGWWVLFAAHVVGDLLPRLPDLDLIRDCGLAMYATLLLWLAGGMVLWRARGLAAPAVEPQGTPARAA
jgi:hypothetical protein